MSNRSMYRMTVRILICLGILAKVAQSQQTGGSLRPSVAGWRHDLDAIASEVTLLHPNPFRKISRVNFSREINYGQALGRAGDRPAGLGSYKCILLIDPDNFEGDAIRQLIAKEDPAGTVQVAKGCPKH